MRPSSPWCQLKYALWLPLYLLFFFYLERRPMPHYWATQLPIDSLIPFCEWFIIPYCLWYPFLIGVGLLLLFRDRSGFRQYMFVLSFMLFLSALVWLLVPNGQDLRPAVMPRDNFLTRWITVLYTVDTNTNVFPSGHVVGSIAAALAVWNSPALRKSRAPAVVLAVLICASTVFIKQHSLLDVLGGLVLAASVAAVVYGLASPPTFRYNRHIK